MFGFVDDSNLSKKETKKVGPSGSCRARERGVWCMAHDEKDTTVLVSYGPAGLLVPGCTKKVRFRGSL